MIMLKRIMLLAAALLSLSAASEVQAQEFVVIVNPANPVSALTRDEVSKLFLKRTTSWSAGGQVAVVDLAKSSKVREAFSQAVHKRAASAVDSYWQQQVFSGKDVPPPEKGTDADVIAFVKSNPGAIGYVAAASTDGVKVVSLK
jgi:ABC-type phosphate transport system substrate-binding protein